MKGIALDNIRKVDQRGEKIEDLDERASMSVLLIAHTVSLASHSTQPTSAQTWTVSEDGLIHRSLGMEAV